MIVVDVNVVAYLLIDGEHTAAAEAVLTADPEWAAPLLWRSEWRNFLAGYMRRGELDRAAALERVEAAERLVQGREYLADSARVMALVEASTCAAYDCEYVALAETLDVPLVTNDRRVLGDFPGRAVAPATYVSAS
ncbi:MAG: type II toxin-antitoxin system VapC family toxin [Gemmatimonadota bacterium]|nr:type II toxin-antitoxin system VapC family toxin [Gemmatimonadota bacterium]